MRQDELDLIEPLPPSPILNSRSPSMARIAQTMDKDDGGRVARRRGKDERGNRHFVLFFCDGGVWLVVPDGEENERDEKDEEPAKDGALVVLLLLLVGHGKELEVGLSNERFCG